MPALVILSGFVARPDEIRSDGRRSIQGSVHYSTKSRPDSYRDTIRSLFNHEEI